MQYYDREQLRLRFVKSHKNGNIKFDRLDTYQDNIAIIYDDFELVYK